MVDIEQLRVSYFENDKPVPYNLKCGINVLIYPIKVENWSQFELSLPILNIEKSETGDMDIIQMSYLSFLKKIVDEDQSGLYNAMLGTILSGSLNLNDIMLMPFEEKTKIVGTLDSTKEYIIIEPKEFDDIKKIILFQNIYDYDDRYISPDVRQLYKDYLETVKSDAVDPSLERKKIFVISKSGILMKDINKMSYRIFNQIYIELVETDMYYANKILQASQKYDVKDDIIYPLFVKKKDKYANLFVGRDSIQNKLDKIQ